MTVSALSILIHLLITTDMTYLYSYLHLYFNTNVPDTSLPTTRTEKRIVG